MMRKRLIISILACCSLAALLSSCASSPRSVVFTDTVDSEQGYVAMHFSGPDLDVQMVELTEREGMRLNLRSSNRLQLVPVEPGDYAIVHLGGTEFTARGQTEYYYEIPRDMMRVIRVRPGRVVYVGQMLVPRVSLLGGLLGRRFEYSYPLDAAHDEFQERFNETGEFVFIGFVE